MEGADAQGYRGEPVVGEVEGVEGGSPGITGDGGEVIVGEVQGCKGWGPVGYRGQVPELVVGEVQFTETGQLQ